MGEKREPKEMTISLVWPGGIRLKPEPDSWFLTPSPASSLSLLQYLEVVPACCKGLYFSFDHTACIHGLAAHF